MLFQDELESLKKKYETLKQYLPFTSVQRVKPKNLPEVEKESFEQVSGIAKAHQAGYSDEEIARGLAEKAGITGVDEALKQGYSPQEIIEYIRHHPKYIKHLEESTPLEQPWFDPTLAIPSGIGGGIYLAGKTLAKTGTKILSKTGAKIITKAGAKAGVGAGAIDVVTGQPTEYVAEKYPSLALPFNIATGVLTGIATAKVPKIVKVKPQENVINQAIEKLSDIQQAGVEIQRFKNTILTTDTPLDLTLEPVKINNEIHIKPAQKTPFMSVGISSKDIGIDDINLKHAIENAQKYDIISEKGHNISFKYYAEGNFSGTPVNKYEINANFSEDSAVDGLNLAYRLNKKTVTLYNGESIPVGGTGVAPELTQEQLIKIHKNEAHITFGGNYIEEPLPNKFTKDNIPEILGKDHPNIAFRNEIPDTDIPKTLENLKIIESKNFNKPRGTLSKFAEYFMPPDFWARKDPTSVKLTTELQEAFERFNYKKDNVMAFMNDLQKSLTDDEQKLVTLVLKTNTPSGIEKVDNVASKLRKYFDTVREDYKGFLRLMVEKNNPKMREALLEAVNGGDITSTAEKYKIDPEDLEELVTKYRNIDNWGIDDYVPMGFKANYIAKDSEGNIIAYSFTKKDLTDQITKYAQLHPEVKKVYLDTPRIDSDLFPTKLSKGNYYKIVSRLADEFGVEIKDIQKLIHERKSAITIEPSYKFSPFLIKRKGKSAGVDNIFDIIRSYEYSMRKKMELDPVIADVKKEVYSIEDPNMRKAILNLVDRVKGQKYADEQIVDNLLSRLTNESAKPFALSRAVNTIKSIVANVKFAYRPISGIVNLFSGMGHTWIKNNTKLMAEAIKLRKSPIGQAILKEEEPYLGKSFILEALESKKSKIAWWKPTGMFQAPEPINREVCYLTNYLYAKNKLNMTEELARQFARRGVRAQQFIYDTASLPRVLSSPTARLMGQFRAYLLNEMAFISTLSGWEIPKYIGLFLTIGGLRALKLTLASLPLLYKMDIFHKAFDYFDRNKVLARISSGVPSLVAKADISAPATFQFPLTTEDWTGVFFSDIVKIYKEIMSETMEGIKHTNPDLIKLTGEIIPAFGYWHKVLSSLYSDDGWIRNEKGEKVYKPTTYDDILFILGAKPLEYSLEKETEREIKREEEIQRKTISNIEDEIGNYILAGKIIPDNLLREAIEHKVLKYNSKTGKWEYQGLKKHVKFLHLTPRQRLMLNLMKSNRYKVFERYAYPEHTTE